MELPGLSEIEEEVVLLVAAGRTPREVAAALRLSQKTVEWHVARASRKLERAASLRERLRQPGRHPADLEGGER